MESPSIIRMGFFLVYKIQRLHNSTWYKNGLQVLPQLLQSNVGYSKIF